MASFLTSNPSGTREGWPSADELRFRGHRGGEIRLHRGMVRLSLSPTDVAHAIVLAVGLTLLWIECLPITSRFWFNLFKYWIAPLNMEGTISMLPQHWLRGVDLSLPFVNVQAGAITPLVWLVTSVVTIGAFAFTYFLGEEYAPWIYVIRALVFIQASALVYFAVASARFPHDVPTYTTGMLSFGIILVGMIPTVLAFTYYLFDFPLWKKLALTALLMGHLTLFFPLQYILHAYILHNSILFMPLLYFAFGPFLDVLIFVCLYSWGMSWKARVPDLP